MILLRRYQPEDLPAIIELFKNTVRKIAIRHYTTAQCKAWAPDDLDAAVWHASLSKNYTVVAMIDGIIVGFADLTASGEINRLYVHHQTQGQGVGFRLFQALEQYAREQGYPELTANVSITAKRLAERMGFVVGQPETVVRQGQELVRYPMHKAL